MSPSVNVGSLPPDSAPLSHEKKFLIREEEESGREKERRRRSSSFFFSHPPQLCDKRAPNKVKSESVGLEVDVTCDHHVCGKGRWRSPKIKVQGGAIYINLFINLGLSEEVVLCQVLNRMGMGNLI